MHSDYDEIDLLVFTCSSRDYVRIREQVKGDGDPTCFSNVQDTGIPALQQWCHQLTVSGRSRTAKQFHTHLKTFASSVRVYVDGIGDVTVADRKSLREKWESIPQGNQGLYDDYDEEDTDNSESEDSLNEPMGGRLTMNNDSSLNVDARGKPIGVIHRLMKVRPLGLACVFCTQFYYSRNSVHILRNVFRTCKVYSVIVLKINVEWAQPM